MTTTYKAGDRVKVVKSPYGEVVPNGTTGTISDKLGSNGFFLYVLLDGVQATYSGDESLWPFRTTEIEPLVEFKVGQRVKVLTDYYAPTILNGDEGVVTETAAGYSATYFRVNTGSANYLFEPSEIEALADEPGLLFKVGDKVSLARNGFGFDEGTAGDVVRAKPSNTRYPYVVVTEFGSHHYAESELVARQPEPEPEPQKVYLVSFGSQVVSVHTTQEGAELEVARRVNAYYTSFTDYSVEDFEVES